MHTLIESALKHCKPCNRDLPVESFAKDRTKKDGLCNTCRKCKGAYKSDWQKRNRPRARGYSEKYYDARGRVDPLPRRLTIYEAARIREIGSHRRSQQRRQRKLDSAMRHLDRDLRECDRCGRSPIAILASRCTACQQERERELERDILRRKYRSDPRYNLTKKFRIAIRDTLTGKQGRRSFDLLPYTVEQLEAHLLSTMPSGCTWTDFIAGRLHVDHVIPIALFNFTTPDDPDFLRCWALSNLQLLKGAENCRKGARMTREFQPMLSYATAS